MTLALTDDVIAYIERSVLCWIATVDAEGFPNVSPKEVFAPFGADTLLIANIASPQTVRNLGANPQVCVSFIDVFAQRGYKLRGVAEMVRPADPQHSQFLAPLRQITKDAFPIRGIIKVNVTAAEPIIAPSYRLIAGTTEQSQVAAAMRAYGVMPRP